MQPSFPWGACHPLPPCLFRPARGTSAHQARVGASAVAVPLLTLSLCFCPASLRRATRAAFGARPPQLQLPSVLQSQLGAGQPSGECASCSATSPLRPLPHLPCALCLAVLQKEPAAAKNLNPASSGRAFPGFISGLSKNTIGKNAPKFRILLFRGVRIALLSI